MFTNQITSLLHAEEVRRTSIQCMRFYRYCMLLNVSQYSASVFIGIVCYCTDLQRAPLSSVRRGSSGIRCEAFSLCTLLRSKFDRKPSLWTDCSAANHPLGGHFNFRRAAWLANLVCSIFSAKSLWKASLMEAGGPPSMTARSGKPRLKRLANRRGLERIT